MSSPTYVKEFAYDLWTTEDGKCWARVRSTGEVTEISLDVMRFLRNEELQIWRHYQPLEDDANLLKRQSYEISHPLSLDCPVKILDKPHEPSWAVSSDDIEKEYLEEEALRNLIRCLTPRQADLFYCCVILGWTQSEYALKNGISKQSVSESFSQIVKKIKKFDWTP